MVLSFWFALHDGEPNFLGWLPGNIGFVLAFFAYQCLVTGAIAEAPTHHDQPGITLLSQEEVDRIRAHIADERGVGSAQANT